MTVMKYNPGFLTHDELIESFCVRKNEFESIIEMLRECDSNSNPHRLVIGPRGCGKTSLLLRVAVEIVRDKELSLSLFPIVFSEESYGVANTDEFWLEALYRLAEQTTRLEGDDDLNLTYKELREIRDDRTLGKRCLSTLLDFSNRYGKRLVLIVENLNLMFRGIMDAEAGWKLRHTLQTEPNIILLASATSRFDEIDKPDRAFYDLFVCQTLQPLGTVECAILWENVSGQHRLPDEMRGLRILTGGSPRLLSIIAKFQADLSFRDLMTDLLKLIDDLTEYFKSHIEALAPQERRVYVALADLWEPATAREVAVQARLDTSKCSAHLKRLIERGAVEVVGGGARRKLYYLAERLYNIYYLLRRSHTQKPLIEALIRFMDAYYSPPELRDVGIRMVREASELEPETKTLHWTAFAQLIDLPVLAADRKELLSKVPKDLAENFGLELSPAVAESIKSTHLESATSKPDKIITEHDEGRDEQTPDEAPSKIEPTASSQIRKEDAATVIRSILHRMETNKAPLSQAEAAREIVDEGVSFLRGHQPEETVVACDEVERQFSEITTPSVLVQVARALNYKGIALARLGRSDEELASYDKVVHRFSSSDESDLRLQVAIALVSKGATLSKINRITEAIATYNEVIRRFVDDATTTLCIQVSRALINKGVMLGKLNRRDEELAAYDEIIHRYGESESPEILEVIARALINKGILLEELNQSEEELVIYEEIARRFGNSNIPILLEAAADATIRKIFVLGRLNRLDEAVIACDEAAKQFSASDVPQVVEHAAIVFFLKGEILNQLKRPSEAVVAYEEVVQRFGDIKSERVCAQVALALNKKGDTFSQLNLQDKELAAYDEVVRRFGGNVAFGVQVQVAYALINKGRILNDSNRLEEAIIVCDEIARRFGSRTEPAIIELTARTLHNKISVLGKMSRLEEAIAVCEEVDLQFRDSDLSGVLDVVAQALMRKGVILDNLKRPEKALAVYDDVLRRFGDTNISSTLEVISQALLFKASLLIQSKHYEEAITICEDIEWRVSDDEIHAFQVHIARALVLKGAALLGLGQEQKAKMIWKESIRRFESSEDAELSLIVSMAMLQIAQLAKKQGQFDEIITIIGQLFERNLNQALHQRCEGLLIRAKAFVALGDALRAERDIEEALALLPDFDDFLGSAIDVLIDFTVLQGPQHVKKIIQASPSVEQLVPFTIAIDKELGNEPRVAREIEEVAEDIRKDLENRQKRNK